MAVYKRANSKFWWYKFTFNNQLIQKSSKTTNKKKARIAESKYYTKLLNGELDINETEPEDVPTFEKAAEDFLEWSKINHAHKPNSFRRVKFSCQPLKKFFGKTRLGKIKTQDIEKYIVWRSKQTSRKTKNPVTHDTINMELILLKTIFKRLSKVGILRKNPAQFVELLAKNKRKFYVLNADEERRYLIACPQPLQDVASLVLETGMRPTEIYNLKCQDILIEKGFLKVENGKTDASNRKIWLSEKAIVVLQSRLARFKGNYLFPKGEEDFNPPTYELNFSHRTTLKRVGLKFRIYDLRHTFATRILEGGTDLLTLAAMLGHSSLGEVMRYAHPSETRKADAIRSMQQKAKAV